MTYSTRYKTPSPMYPEPSPTTLERLLASWESLRALDVEGYRTSSAHPMSTWLVDIEWADARSVRSPGRGTTCSPFVTQSIAMAYSNANDWPLRPRLANGQPLSFLFSRAANGTLSPAFLSQMAKHAMTLADNEWPRPIILFNMGYAIEPQHMRRGDAVHIDWESGGGHAVFCWDVHLNQDGEVDAFQYVSSNGRILVDGRPEGAGLGVSVGGTPSGPGGFIRQLSSSPIEYEALRNPLFVDDERYVAEAAWVTWNPKLKINDLTNCRSRPRGRLCHARTVKAARLHGVVTPPPFAMLSPSAVDSPSVSSASRTSSGRAEEADHRARLRLIQKQLKMLAVLGWINADPGPADGRVGAKTETAIRSFQHHFMLTVDGVAGPKTLSRLQHAYESACATAEGRAFLATGAPPPMDQDLGQVSFSPSLTSHVPACLYFRHAAASPGDCVEVILELEDAEGVPLQMYLRPADGSPEETELVTLVCRGGVARGSIRVPGPKHAHAGPPRAYIAGIAALSLETRAPLIVL